jgi:alpha-beta hydrolase superfamily lysophospholipase
MRNIGWLVGAVGMTLLPVGLAGQSGAYRTTRGTQELATEAYRWTGRTLDATVDVPFAGHRVVTQTVYDGAWEPVSYDVRVLSLATGAEQRAVHVTFDDSVHWTVEGQSAGGARALPPPRAVMQNLLWSHLAAMARRLEPRGDTTVVLHTFLVDNASVLDLTLARTGGRVTATVAGTEIVLARSADGDLDSAEVSAQGLRVERVAAESVSASRPLVPRAPAPPPAGVTEEPFAWTDGSQRLEGTVALPAHPGGKVPVVLIIAGSGPTDRDGNNPLGVHSDIYKKLAWALAERGIASVRYDKRGIGASRFTGDFAAVTFGDYVDDAIAGARALAADPRFATVVLVGHSEGALLAERAANQGAPVAGVVMMAGMGRPFTTVLREQMARQLDSAQLAVYDRTIAAYLAAGPMPAVDSSLRPLLNRSVRRFIQTESAIDPAAEARRLPVPLLVLQGSTDIQVSVKDAEALRAARPDAEVRILPDANHLFVHCATTDPVAQAATYTDPALPLVPELVPLIAGFAERVAR